MHLANEDVFGNGDLFAVGGGQNFVALVFEDFEVAGARKPIPHFQLLTIPFLSLLIILFILHFHIIGPLFEHVFHVVYYQALYASVVYLPEPGLHPCVQIYHSATAQRILHFHQVSRDFTILTFNYLPSHLSPICLNPFLLNHLAKDLFRVVASRLLPEAASKHGVAYLILEKRG